jgi:hypothetical protein
VPGLCIGGELPPPPPHPKNNIRPKQTAHSCDARFLRYAVKIIEKTGNHAAYRTVPILALSAPTGAVVTTETVTEAALPPGVTVPGVTEHVLEMGAPEQASAIGLVNVPASGVMLKAYEAVCPTPTVCDGGLAATAKSITAKATLCVLEAGAPMLLPETVSEYRPAGVVESTVTVTVTVTGLPDFGFTNAAGEKVQVIPEAGELHDRSTAAVKVPAAPTWMVNCELPPGVMFRADGDGALNVKSETSTVTGV